jgi:hypothetical protein
MVSEKAKLPAVRLEPPGIDEMAITSGPVTREEERVEKVPREMWAAAKASLLTALTTKVLAPGPAARESDAEAATMVTEELLWADPIRVLPVAPTTVDAPDWSQLAAPDEVPADRVSRPVPPMRVEEEAEPPVRESFP